MKNLNFIILPFLAATIMFSSCSSSKSTVNHQPIEIQKFKRDEYVVLDNLKGEAKSNRFWLLFIPFGGKSDQKLYEKAYDKAVKSAVGQKADGLLEPRYTYKKITIPLIVVSWTTKKVTAEGKAFRIKTEDEYQNSKKTNEIKDE
ncbi:MAG: hypothetical protein JSS90_03405 [Bacteroidetes bacterium]|jgi:hypothetical protein|nr:hypothetical protein [Bacteroidota bacterium]